MSFVLRRAVRGALLLVAVLVVAACARAGFGGALGASGDGSVDASLASSDARAGEALAPEAGAPLPARHQRCLKGACGPGLVCLVGDASDTCVQVCQTEKDCEPNETCVAATAAKLVCMLSCTGGIPCPQHLECAGSNDFAEDVCMPDPTTPPKARCGVEPCTAAHRCVSMQGGDERCYPLCSQGSCGTTELCIKSSPFDFCVSRCDPFTGAECESFEVCAVEPNLGESICLAVQGISGVCGGNRVCDTGTACVNGECAALCDAKHACASGSCTQLQAGGNNLPWKACL